MSYILVEQQYLSPHRANGLALYKTRIGFLDFLREIQTAGNSLPSNTEYRVVGLEQVLFLCNNNKMREEAAFFFHKVLVSNASLFERKHIQVQIVFKEKLIYAQTLCAEYRNEHLPIDLIFGKPRKTLVHGEITCYQADFNLTS